jgi:uncharacterized protein (TIGR03067 family)
MRGRVLIALTVVSLGSAATPEEDRAKLQGTWVCTWMKMGGLSGTAKGVGNVPIGIRFAGEQYVEFNGKADSPTNDFKLYPTKQPKEMDLITDDIPPPLIGGPKVKTTIPCIYEIHGDKLKVCMGVTARPKAFDSRRVADDEAPETLLIYKRVKSPR